MSYTNKIYQDLLRKVLQNGVELTTRNHSCISDVSGLQLKFDTPPLVTMRKTAWRKALIEMEWFMSGSPYCPEPLMNWWEKQLSPDKAYFSGYSQQLRNHTSVDGSFDQIAYVLKALREHPNSRRIITTTWHPEEMANITKINDNPATPTTCHGSLTQYFVRNDTLYMHTFQRSADLLLGVPHNWIQYWSLLMYFAEHSGLMVGSMTWTFGDAHIYNDPSHIDCVKEILACIPDYSPLEMTYQFSGKREENIDLPVYSATDFSIAGYIPKPSTTIKPKLF